MAFFSRSPQPAATTTTGAVETESLAPNALIGLRNIEKSYAHGTSRSYVLRRINIDIKDGEFVSIMGPSGAGKSTLLHIIGMHDSAWTGEFFFNGHPVHQYRHQGWRVRVDHGAIGRGQVDAAAHHRHARQRLDGRVLLQRPAGA